jgi:hypothetical protein
MEQIKGLAVREFRSVRYRIKEAGPPPLLCEAVLPQEVLLGMAGHLCWGPCCDEVPGNASPVALPELLEAGEEHPVLFLGPWNSFLPLLNPSHKAIRRVPTGDPLRALLY